MNLQVLIYYSTANANFPVGRVISMQKRTNLTIDDIARDLGVSKTTVSRALSGKGRISSATRDRILAHIRQTNYRPSAAAKGLSESKTFNIALMIPKSLFRLDMPFVRQSMTAICEEAFLQSYNILLCLTTDSFPAPLVRTLDDRKVDGVILARTVEKDPLVDTLCRRNIPFATMGSLPRDARGLATVEADHDQVGGCRAFCMDFLQRGSGDVALLGNDMNYIVNQSRLAGFYQAASELGLSYKHAHTAYDIGDAAACIHTVDQFLQQGVTRFLAMDDNICLHTLTHFQELGLRVPEDVQIGSLYDSDALAACQPGISALHFDAGELGRVTCRELLRCLRGEEYDPHPTLGYRILMRESV